MKKLLPGSGSLCNHLLLEPSNSRVHNSSSVHRRVYIKKPIIDIAVDRGFDARPCLRCPKYQIGKLYKSHGGASLPVQTRIQRHTMCPACVLPGMGHSVRCTNRSAVPQMCSLYVDVFVRKLFVYAKCIHQPLGDWT